MLTFFRWPDWLKEVIRKSNKDLKQGFIYNLSHDSAHVLRVSNRINLCKCFKEASFQTKHLHNIFFYISMHLSTNNFQLSKDKAMACLKSSSSSASPDVNNTGKVWLSQPQQKLQGTWVWDEVQPLLSHLHLDYTLSPQLRVDGGEFPPHCVIVDHILDKIAQLFHRHIFIL